MTDAPQAPYDDEGDARPVSLIGAKISSVRDAGSSTEGTGDFGTSGSGGDVDDRRASSRPPARRGRRRRGDHPGSVDPGLTDTQAFLLGGDATPPDDSLEGEPEEDLRADAELDQSDSGPSGSDPGGSPAGDARPPLPETPGAELPTAVPPPAAAAAGPTDGPTPDPAPIEPDPDAAAEALPVTNPTPPPTAPPPTLGPPTAPGPAVVPPANPAPTADATAPEVPSVGEQDADDPTLPGVPAPIGFAAPPATASTKDGPARPVHGERPGHPIRRDVGPTTFPAPPPRRGRPAPPARSVAATTRDLTVGAATASDATGPAAAWAAADRPTEPPTIPGEARLQPDDLPPFGAPLDPSDGARHRRSRDTGRPAAFAPRPPLGPPPGEAAPEPPTAGVAAAPAPVATRAEVDRQANTLWPWPEPVIADVSLEPWEEIPVREPLIDRAAAPLSGSRRIAVVSIGPRVGRTTITAAAGLELAGARREAVVAVDPSAEPAANEPAWSAPLASRVGVFPTGNARVLVSARADLASFGDVRRLVGGSTGAVGRDWSGEDEVGGGWPESGSYGEGLDVLPVRGLRRDGLAPLDLRDLNGALTDLDSWYPLVLVDCPAGLDDTVTSAVLTESHAVVLVTRATPADLREAVDAVVALTGSPAAGNGSPPVVIVAVTSLRRGRWSPRTRAAASALGGHVSGLVRIPYDRTLAGQGTIRGPRSRRRTRKAFLRLAATIVESCVSADPRQPLAVAGVVRKEIG